jgi:hypothetical protein
MLTCHLSRHALSICIGLIRKFICFVDEIVQLTNIVLDLSIAAV